MADCSKYSTQLAAEINALQQAQNTYRDLNSRVNNIQTIDQGDRLDELLGDLTGQFQFIESQFLNILRSAQNDGCSAQVAEAKRYAAIASNFAGSSFSSQQTAKSNTGQLRQEELASRSATTKENNAGTGTPGTAGKGADGLEEVTVTGKKSPATVSEPGTGDGLEEVSVTGKRAPGTVTEPTSGDALDEVTVTGKRATDPSASGNNNTVPGIKNAQSQAVLKDTTNFAAKKDWRVRLSLSPGANYLYKAQNPGILQPLLATDGVLFPYTPSIQVAYSASYDSTSLTHTNYKFYQYANSNIDNVQITCDFTAQDTSEANYLLAVIHFFRSVTKMFYGQDQNPKPGTPPPLCYLFGLGEYQFNAHPLAITNFSYSLPNNVDYIRANIHESGQSTVTTTAKRSNLPIKAPEKPSLLNVVAGALSQSRLVQGISKLGGVIGVDLTPGGGLANPDFQNNKGFNSVVPPGTNEPTYVPTSIQISISCIPIVSRYDISNQFSLKDYATGELLRGVKRSGGGIW